MSVCQHTSAYVSIRQHTPRGTQTPLDACLGDVTGREIDVSICTFAPVSKYVCTRASKFFVPVSKYSCTSKQVFLYH
jgi:hypothetical protein